MKSLFVALSSAALLSSTIVAADHDHSMGQNKLSAAEEKQGWKLLFDGKDLSGWHNFKSTTVKPGWKVENGELVCVDPHNAGDLCTDGKYDWYELDLEFKMGPKANSGIMYHVTDEAGSAW